MGSSGAVRHLVWDWNGTLVDDHSAVVAAINDALAGLRLRPIDSEAFRTHFTRPVQRFYEQVAGRPIEPGEWEALDAAYHDSYGGRVQGLKLAADALAALEAAEAAGLGQSLLSMWRHQDLVPLVERLGIARFFVRVDGLRVPGGGGKAEHLVEHLAALEVEAPAALLVGFSFAFFYHLMNGVRHLVWDAGHGFEKKQARASGWIVFLGAIVLTAFLWFLLARGGAA